MTFPTIGATNSGNSGSSESPASTYNAPLPASIAAGNLLLLFVVTSGSVTVNTPSGWTQLFAQANSTTIKLTCFYKLSASGSEGSTVSLSLTSSTTPWVTISYRISGHDNANAPSSGTATGNTGSGGDGPSLSPSGGAKDYLWIAANTYSSQSSGTSAPTAPSGYSNVVHNYNSGSKIPALNLCGTASKTSNTATEDPGAFTYGSSGQAWVGATIAVAPAAAAAGKFQVGAMFG